MHNIAGVHVCKPGCDVCCQLQDVWLHGASNMSAESTAVVSDAGVQRQCSCSCVGLCWSTIGLPSEIHTHHHQAVHEVQLMQA
jgi:hypothetical protein